MDAPVTVGTMLLEPPLVNGSGVVDVVSCDDAWNVPEALVRRLGAFVTKTVTATARAGEPQPWAEAIGPGSLVNAAGLPNPGIDAALAAWAELPDRLGIPVIVSIGGDCASFGELARRVNACGWASAIELNLSCPNVDGGLLAADPARAAAATSAVRAQTQLPVLAKLTPACGSPAAVARAVVAAGADALTCGNTMPIHAVAADGSPLLAAGPDGGLSGVALHPMALRLVSQARSAVDVPIVGLGGVDGVAAARRMRAAGADIVGVGTGVVHDAGLVAELAGMLSAGRPPARV